MPQSRYYRIGYGLLLLFLIIWVGTKIPFIFRPLVVMFQTLFTPLLISGLLYYAFRPAVSLLVSRKVPKTISILVVFAVVIIIVTLLTVFVAPVIETQFTELLDSLPSFMERMNKQWDLLIHTAWFKSFSDHLDLDMNRTASKMTEYLEQGLTVLSTRVTAFIGFLANTFIVIVTIPFILFYMLKDGVKMKSGLLLIFPLAKRKSINDLLWKIDETVSLYIRGQIIVALCVGFLLLLGYSIIGIDYVFLLAVAAVLTNVIPYIGAFIAAVPAVIVAFSYSPLMVLKVLAVTIVAQQIEGNVISPVIVGKQLEIHPLTIIILLLVSGSLMGLLGMLLAVPAYAIGKVIISHVRGEEELNS
ncbi:MAG: family transporter [Paenibacillus sp.]|jgi:predicted PurR-regulated permease PerM|nr:family transporter [Paenibacillus sp.]